MQKNADDVHDTSAMKPRERTIHFCLFMRDQEEEEEEERKPTRARSMCILQHKDTKGLVLESTIRPATGKPHRESMQVYAED
jgi:hypothetical protein